MNEQSQQVYRSLPATRGLVWFSEGWGLIRRQPLRLLLISLFFQLCLSFTQAHVLGLLVVLCLPVLSAGMLHAFFLVERGDKPTLAVLFLPFTAKRRVIRLLLLGGSVMLLALLLVSLVLTGQLLDIDPEILARIEQGELDALQLLDPQIIQNAVLAMAVAAAFSGTVTYFSVPLIWFKKQALGRAVVTGLMALGSNWRPLLVIGVLLGLVAIPVVLLIGSVYLSSLGGETASTGLAFLLLFLSPMFQLLLFGTQYMAFRDVFGLDVTATGAASNPADQLLA